MTDLIINPKRIRDNALPHKSISLNEEDFLRVAYLEKIYTERYPMDAPFSFSNTISKAIEIAFANASNPEWGDLTQKRLNDLDEVERRSSRIGKLKRKKN
ncbi:MAG: hypothetical protein ACPK85_07115 [Methanosarcina sp.]